MRLTSKMKQYRDQLSAASSNCKVWFPCDEGDGQILTDVIGGVTETDSAGLATHDEPHAITFGKASAAPTSGNYPALKENLLLVLSQKVVTTAAFMVLTLGDGTKVSVSYGQAIAQYEAGVVSQTVLSSIGSAPGDIFTVACAVIGGTIYHYYSINGAGITSNGSADASNFIDAFSGGVPTLSNTSVISSIAARQHLFGAGLFTFGQGEFTQAEIIAALNEIDGNWPAGKKYLPDSIL